MFITNKPNFLFTSYGSHNINANKKIKYSTGSIGNGKSFVVPSYPKAYYLSFKGSNVVLEKQKFIDFLDETYKKHKDKPLSAEYFNIRYEDCKTESTDVNYAFQKMINREIQQKPFDVPTEEDSLKVLKKAFDSAMNSSKNSAFEEYEKDEETPIPGQFNEFIELYKQRTSDESVKINPDDSSSVMFAFQDYIEDKLGVTDRFQSDRLYYNFRNSYYKNVDVLKSKHFDKAFLEKIKSNLDNEPFVKYWEQCRLYNKQLVENNVPSIDDFAEDIYKDIVDKKISPFKNPKFYKYLQDTDAKLDIVLHKLYGVATDSYLQAFENSGIDKKQKSLLVDPAIFNSFDKFVDFIHSNNINTKDIEPSELRQRYSDSLGTVTVYRGLYFDDIDEVMDEIKKNGNLSAVFKDKEKAKDAIKFYVGKLDDCMTISGRIHEKVCYNDKFSEFLSVSSYYDVAAAVPKQWGQADTPVIVIKAKIPALDVIRQENYFKNIQNGAIGRELIVGKKRYPYMSEQQNIEGFVPFFLPTDNAEFSVDTTTEGFHWQFSI